MIADLKRKRDDADVDDAPNKVARILNILEGEDREGLLDRNSPSLRALLSTSTTPLSILKTAIASLEQQQFCDLAISLLDHNSAKHPNYALLQHLPSGHWWSSLTSPSSTANIQTAKAELVAILPSPSSFESSSPTLAACSSKSFQHKKFINSHRILSTGSFLNYGLFSSFAPSFDQDCELVGRRELGQVLYYQEQNFRNQPQPSILQIQTPQDCPDPPSKFHSLDPDLDLETLLPPDQVKSLKAALNSLELENSVQNLLERNQRALVRLEELQTRRLTNHPTSNAEEDSEEWDIGSSVFIILTDFFPLISVLYSSGRP
jgi:hypothetical protein